MLTAGQIPSLPEHLLELVASRIAALPRATQEGLAAIAALSYPALRLVSTVAGDEDALRPAFAAHVLELDGDRLRFSHPLLAAAAHEAVDPVGRRALYRRLAGLVSDEDERARLLALGANGPDGEVAGALERAAARAQQRGASAAAAELCEQAHRLTPRDARAEHDRRSICAARYHWAAGDTEQARTILEEAATNASSRRARAESQTELAWVHAFQANQPGAVALARRALDDLERDSDLRAHALNCVSSALAFMLEDLEQAARLWEEAVKLSERRNDVAGLSENLCGVGWVASFRGSPEADAVLAEAEELGPEAWGWQVMGWPSMHRAGVCLWTDRPGEAIRLSRRLQQEAAARGDYGSMPAVLCHLALSEVATGRWPDAEATASEGYEAAAQAGDAVHQAIALAARALVRTFTGHPAEARKDAEDALAITGERSIALARINAQWALALLDLLAERPQDAADRLAPLRRRLVAAGVGEPGVMPFAADEIEALLTAGRISAAEEAIDWLEAGGQRLDRASALAGARRGRGLVAAAMGKQDAAIAAFERAVEQHGRVTMPFERARTLLHLGAAQRRAKRKADARGTLSEARRVFDSLGARPCATRADQELARISGRRPGGSELTATESRIATEAASGRSNREIAASLFLSERTVEANLTRVYRKLGVRSRAPVGAADAQHLTPVGCRRQTLPNAVVHGGRGDEPLWVPLFRARAAARSVPHAHRPAYLRTSRASKTAPPAGPEEVSSMFTSRRVTRALALAATSTAMAAASGVAAAAPVEEPVQPRSADPGADVDRALAVEQYYSSYGDPRPIAPSKPRSTGDTDWPMIGLVGAGGVLLALGSGTAVSKIRVRRGTAGVTA